MSPTGSRAVLYLLISILFASCIVNAVALPHQVLDARTPAAHSADIAKLDQALQVATDAAAAANNDKKKNFFEKIAETLRSYNGWQIFRDFWARLFGGRNGEDDDSDDSWKVTTTVYITATAGQATSVTAKITPTSSLASPSGSLVESLVIPTPTESAEQGFSILPIGPTTTAIDVEFLTPVFSTASEDETLVPILETTTAGSLLPTPAIITDEFSVTIPTELLTESLPLPTDSFVPSDLTEFTSSLEPTGTDVALPWSGNSSESATSLPFILTNPLRPTEVANETVASNASSTAISLTSVTIVTETWVASPVPVTGTGAPISAGTGFPISVDASPIWPNSTFAIPSVIPGTGTGSPLAGSALPSSEIPLYPNATSSFTPSIVLVTGTGSPSGTTLPPSESPWYSNITSTSATIIIGTGTGSPSAGTVLPLSESPLYPNNTSTEPTLVPVPITVTGVPGSVLNVSVTIPLPPFPNTTDVVGISSLPVGTGTVAVSAGTALPIPVSESPLYPNNTANTAPTALSGTGTFTPSAGTISAIPTASETPLYPNTTIIILSTGLPGTGSAIASTGSIPSVSEIPLFPNTTIATATNVINETATATSILPPLETPDSDENETAVEFPGLQALRAICRDTQTKVVTLPLLNRFYGPNAYPSLYKFPGCTRPNERQAFQAPGLLDCSALGAEVQNCQASGKKVLLSVKADGLSAAKGNAGFGDPAVSGEPFGPYFQDKAGVWKRQTGVDAGNEPDVILPEPESLDMLPGSDPDLIIPIPDFSVGDEAGTLLPAPSPLIAPITDIALDPAFTVPVAESTDIPILTEDPILEDPPYPILDLTAPAPIALNGTASPTIATPVVIAEPIESDSTSAVFPLPILEPTIQHPEFPNLFDAVHPPSAFALTLFSLFGEGHTERADLRPLGPDTPSGASPAALNGTDWINPILTALQRPLGEEVIVDGFDIQVPAEWKDSYQEGQFKALVSSLRNLNKEAWVESGGVVGGAGDLGADGRSVAYFGWIGGSLKQRSLSLDVTDDASKEGWREWDGTS